MEQQGWKTDVKFVEKGKLLATASGVLLVPPKDALAFVTDEAGDSLFRVVKRESLPAAPDGSIRVHVVNKAAIRVLAWKIWSKNHVVYEISGSLAQGWDHVEAHNKQLGDKSDVHKRQETAAEQVTFTLQRSNMLHSLTGTWRLQPTRIHYSTLPPSLLAFNAAGRGPPSSTPKKHPSLSLRLNGSGIGRHSCTDNQRSSSCGGGNSSEGRSNTNGNSSSNTGSSSMGSSGAAGGLLKKLNLTPKGRGAGLTDLFSGSLLSPRSPRSPRILTGSLFSPRSPRSLTGSLFSPRSPRKAAATSTAKAAGSSSGGCSSGSRGVDEGLWESQVPQGIQPDEDGYITATLVYYEQLAQPKGMPPGIRLVPGLSDAVRSSVGREMKQMLDKLSCVAHVAVTKGLKPQAALREVSQQVELAGGSFKKLQQQQKKERQQQQRHAQLLQPPFKSDPAVQAAAISPVAAVAAAAADEGWDGLASSLLSRALETAKASELSPRKFVTAGGPVSHPVVWLHSVLWDDDDEEQED